jgi:hypothetical protein
METTAEAPFPVDRVCNWYEELQRIGEKLGALSPGAVRAVGSVIVSFVQEDVRGVLEPHAFA